MSKRPFCAALIVAAGHGVRAGDGLPKQYRQLANAPVLRRSIEAFARHPAIDHVQVVISPEHRQLYDSVVEGLGLPAAIHGGDTRQDSVRLGLEGLADAKPALVLIHDAARPLISSETIAAIVAALETADGALPVLPASDTLKRLREGRVEATLARDGVGLAQTPQGFRFEKILPVLLDHRQVARFATLVANFVPGNR